MARLASIVHVVDESGRSFVFGPADEVPAWAESRITNPAAWDELPVSRLTEPEPAPVKAATPRRTGRRKAVAGDAPLHNE